MVKLTDNLMAQLYLGFADDYMQIKKETTSAQEIYNQLYRNLCFSFDSPSSSLYNPDSAERQRALAALETFITACPEYRTLPLPHKSQVFVIQPQPLKLTVIENTYYCSNSDTIFTWMMLSSMMSHSHEDGHGGVYDSDNQVGKLLAALLFIVLGIFAAILALISVYYIFSQFLNSMERFLYNEGWLKAAITLASIIAGAAVGAFFATFVASVPIIALSIAAGLSNPLGMAILGIVCITLITAAISCGITNWIQNKAIEKTNTDALDPKDPYRFKITESDAKKMRANNIDPDKALLAMIAIREQMGKENVPSLLNRLFTSSGKEKQQLLQLVRAIRNGSVQDVSVGEMVFNLRQEPSSTQCVVPSYHLYAPPLPMEYYPNFAVDHEHASSPYAGSAAQGAPYSGHPTQYPQYYGANYNSSLFPVYVPPAAAPGSDCIYPTLGAMEGGS
ncbi:MAG: hypothetical protein Q8M03_01550 [Legionella sp.]|nr:hypothetical protein [Legionella sp.]